MAKLRERVLTRLRRRDPDALREIVDEHARPPYRAARDTGFTIEEAEDLAQDVFVAFLESLERFEGRAQSGTWLFGILHHKAQERRRSRARDELNDPIDTAFEAQFAIRGNWIRPLTASDRAASAHEAGEAIRECLEGLPPLQREVFQLRQVEDLSAPDVGNVLAQTVTHIGVREPRAVFEADLVQRLLR